MEGTVKQTLLAKQILRRAISLQQLLGNLVSDHLPIAPAPAAFGPAVWRSAAWRCSGFHIQWITTRSSSQRFSCRTGPSGAGELERTISTDRAREFRRAS